MFMFQLILVGDNKMFNCRNRRSSALAFVSHTAIVQRF
jgi:hypothetical protein